MHIHHDMQEPRDADATAESDTCTVMKLVQDNDDHLKQQSALVVVMIGTEISRILTVTTVTTVAKVAIVSAVDDKLRTVQASRESFRLSAGAGSSDPAVAQAAFGTVSQHLASVREAVTSQAQVVAGS